MPTEENMNTITGLVNNVGFAIVVCGFLAWGIVQLIKMYEGKLNNQTSDHKEIIRALIAEHKEDIKQHKEDHQRDHDAYHKLSEKAVEIMAANGVIISQLTTEIKELITFNRNHNG